MKKVGIVLGSLAMVISISACTPTERSTVTGAVIGGVAGGAISGRGSGAAVGAAVGGTAGYLIGRDREHRGYR